MPASSDRRALMQSAASSLAGLAPGGGKARAAEGGKLGAPGPFSFDPLKTRAEAMAALPYAAPALPASNVIARMTTKGVRKFLVEFPGGPLETCPSASIPIPCRVVRAVNSPMSLRKRRRMASPAIGGRSSISQRSEAFRWRCAASCAQGMPCRPRPGRSSIIRSRRLAAVRARP